MKIVVYRNFTKFNVQIRWPLKDYEGLFKLLGFRINAEIETAVVQVKERNCIWNKLVIKYSGIIFWFCMLLNELNFKEIVKKISVWTVATILFANLIFIVCLLQGFYWDYVILEDETF